MIRFVPWSEVGTITVSPGDNVVEVGAFELAEGADTLWVRMTNTGTPGPWPWSYGILSFKTDEGQPLGSIKAYNSFDGEVFRLGVGLPPSVRAGVLTFEPRGFNMAWIKQGNPWTLKFEAQAGTSGGNVSSLWSRDPVNANLSPVTPGDGIKLGTGDVSADKGLFSGDVSINEGHISLSATGALASYGPFWYRSVNPKAFNVTAYQASGSDGIGCIISLDGTHLIGGDLDQPFGSMSPAISLFSSGGAAFTGHVTAPNITFRSTDPAWMRGADYIGPELDLLEEIKRLEALVKHLYDTLRLTPPAGWPVWDGNEDLINSNIAKSRHI